MKNHYTIHNNGISYCTKKTVRNTVTSWSRVTCKNCINLHKKLSSFAAKEIETMMSSKHRYGEDTPTHTQYFDQEKRFFEPK
jgi:hypothetical protein